MNNFDQEIFDQELNNLSLFYRDTTLSEDLISKYKTGQILTERGFTDMSTLGGGLAGNLRYLIASAHAKDISSLNTDTHQGHVMLHSGAFFKVLDIYKVGDQTQIFLLEIPEEAVNLFERATSNQELDLIAKAKQDFDILLTFPPEPALENPDWKERTEFPIGMDDQGVFFYQGI